METRYINQRAAKESLCRGDYVWFTGPGETVIDSGTVKDIVVDPSGSKIKIITFENINGMTDETGEPAEESYWLDEITLWRDKDWPEIGVFQEDVNVSADVLVHVNQMMHKQTVAADHYVVGPQAPLDVIYEVSFEDGKHLVCALGFDGNDNFAIDVILFDKAGEAIGALKNQLYELRSFMFEFDVSIYVVNICDDKTGDELFLPELLDFVQYGYPVRPAFYTRTNMFKVKDEAAFRDLIKNLYVSTPGGITTGKVKILVGRYFDGKRFGFFYPGAISGYNVDAASDDVAWDVFIAKLQACLDETDAVLMETCDNARKSAVGSLVIITSSSYVNMPSCAIHPASDKVKELLHVPNWALYFGDCEDQYLPEPNVQLIVDLEENAESIGGGAAMYGDDGKWYWTYDGKIIDEIPYKVESWRYI